MKGWVLIDHAVPGEIDAGQSLPRVADGSAYEWFQDVAVLSTWALVEPQPDRFDWGLMDQAMAFWAAQGKRLHLRFSTDQFGRFRLPGMVMPVAAPAVSAGRALISGLLASGLSQAIAKSPAGFCRALLFRSAH